MRVLRTVAILAANSWQENLRSRFFLLSAVFGGVFLYVSLLLGVLAVDQELRVLLDFGLGFIELLGLSGALYGATTVILREMESKTITLILTRPVGRGPYLLGRFAGLLFSLLVSMGLMSAVHLSILFWKGWAWSWDYPWALCGAFLKVLVTAALGTFVALFSSSAPTALTIAGTLWTLGHFLPEIRFMIPWGSPWGIPLHLASCVIPDLQLFNLRDRAWAGSAQAEPAVLIWLLYALVYSSVWLFLARQLLRRKEF